MQQTSSTEAVYFAALVRRLLGRVYDNEEKLEPLQTLSPKVQQVISLFQLLGQRERKFLVIGSKDTVTMSRRISLIREGPPI